MMAYAEGKDVEYSIKGSDTWVTCDQKLILSFNCEAYNYRIKKEPTYRPFKNAEECWKEMQKHQPIGWIKSEDDGFLCNIKEIHNDGAMIGNNYYYTYYKEAFENYEFVDGTPFGIKEE